MNPPVRRKSLALLTCYGVTCALAGACATTVHAQGAATLRVDPALLGLPPGKPAATPAPATTAEKPAAEALPVQGAVVDAVPDSQDGEKTPLKRPVRVPADAGTKPAVGLPADQVSGQAVKEVLPVPMPVAKKETKPIEKVAAQPVPSVKPAPSASANVSSASSSSTLSPLRVDPALLGMSPTGRSAAVTRPDPIGGATGRRQAMTLARASGGRKITSAEAEKSWFGRIWDPVANAYDQGAWEFYLPVRTHHLRSRYSAEKIASYQESPLGFGVGSGLYNEHGNWEGVYAMAFQDSHFKPMYTAGYGWKAIWRPAEDVRLGLGYTAGLMSRTDIFGYVPFPIILPMASVAYKNFSLESTFVPGGQGNGNIFFIWAKWELGKPGEKVGTPARPAAPAIAETALAFSSSERTMPLAEQRVPFGPQVGSPTVDLSDQNRASQTNVAATGRQNPVGAVDMSTATVLGPAGETSSVQVGGGESTQPPPVFLSSHRMAGAVEREFVAEGDAELRKADTIVNADRLTYWPIEDEIEAEGGVRLAQGGDVIAGPKMRLRLEDQVGFFDEPEYTLKRQPKSAKQDTASKVYAETYAGLQQSGAGLASGFAPPQSGTKSKAVGRKATEAHGVADRIDFEGENQVRLTNATYTTCSPGNDDWYAKTSSMHLDYDREVGEGDDGTVYFKGVPIFYTPWLSFSLNNQRKSGFLAPSLGTNSDSGVEFSLPYYWNIAPNMDTTITPRVISKRGLQLNNEFRYLNSAYGGLYQGQVKAEYLPGDKLRDGDNRYGLSLNHNQATANGFGATINYNKVSDDNYYTDLSSGIAATSATQLMQQGVLTYGGGGWWNATANFQQYQTLQPDADNPVLEQYRMLPQFTVNARKPDLYGTDSSFMGQYTNFTINKRTQVASGVSTLYPDGQRTVLYPQVAVPYVTPGWYVTPKLGLNVSHYALSDQATGTPDTINRTLPIFSVDSGMTFERQSNWFGRDYTQTLEPRLYYLNIPYKNQDQIPLFDTALADFNFAQIFSENQFSGWDRINNANQLTTAVTSRLLEPESGNEIMRAMLGQRFYFERNKVGLDTTSTVSSTDNKWDKSDILAAFSGQVWPKVYADAAWQYNVSDRQVKRFSLGGRYQPQPGKVLNASYRFNRDDTAPIDQVDFSGQWPLSGRWHAVGRLNYSFKDDATNLNNTKQGGRIIESIAGLEYNGGCWVARGVVQRTALTQENATTAFFVQLELNDFSRIGSNPINLLKRNIQGYSLINESGNDAGLSNFGE